MPVATTVALAGIAIAGGVAQFSASKTQAKRATAQGKIAARQGELELKRSAQSVEEAMLELEDARGYQQWKETYVEPVLGKMLDDPTQSDPAAMRARQNLGRGIDVGDAQGAIAQGVTGAGFDLGGSRHQAAGEDIANSLAAQDVATLGAASEGARQQGISNTGTTVQAGRQVYKQQGIV
jgi:hypothetical protein